ncbi:FAD-dependent oxidoreductase [Nannocystis sp. SCPEA4]|uniref:NAD(P)/FAD-dependent oxidoreductase n=1 Tax=Nannocystis sp. SCPEA4 TaxID=2996787 RepID=UPI002271830E|nr:FAD-dependent oxidoreductase [Nannocystis sp. SCPEA4]MCY1055814.1 FAD-dependent oxidoreductase [Nannocystis sp. SCPEA4]
MAQGTVDDATADVLILGASFAGVELLYQLRRNARGRGLKIVVVDRQAEHPYIPLVQERLVGRIDAAGSVLATRRYVEGPAKARYVVGDVVGLDPDRKEVTLASGERLRARFIVVALGSVLAPPAAIEGAERFVDYKFDREFVHAADRLGALLAPGGEAPRRLASGEGPYREGEGLGPTGERPALVVVGGGISGVELAGELGRLARVRPAGWRAPKVTLVHSGARLLPHLCDRAGATAERHLRAQGVELRLNTRLTRLAPGTAAIRPSAGGSEVATEDVPCDMAFWSGGVRPAPVLAKLPLPRTDDGWLAVGPTLQCFATAKPTRPDIFAIGDAARVQSGTGEWPTMQRAIECLGQASLTARNLTRLAHEAPDYPHGVPPLRPHTLREDFFHGISLGDESLIVYGRLVLDFAAVNTWFRRFLMRRYFARYS